MSSALEGTQVETEVVEVPTVAKLDQAALSPPATDSTTVAAAKTSGPAVEIDAKLTKDVNVELDIGKKPARAVASVPLVLKDDQLEVPKPLKTMTKRKTQPIAVVELEPKSLPPTPVVIEELQKPEQVRRPSRSTKESFTMRDIPPMPTADARFAAVAAMKTHEAPQPVVIVEKTGQGNQALSSDDFISKCNVVVNDEVKKLEKGPSGERTWASGLFDPAEGTCGDCFLSWCCPCFLFGETHYRFKNPQDPELKGFDDFNAACCLFYAGSVFFCGIPSCIVSITQRNDVRESLRIKGSGFKDFCTMSWCTPCARVQTNEQLKREEDRNILMQGGSFAAQPKQQTPMAYVSTKEKEQEYPNRGRTLTR